MLSSKNSLAVLRKTNALLDGHFVLSSGLHSPSYVQCAKLLSNPKILLLDEPFAALDIMTIKNLQQIIVDLQTQNNISIILYNFLFLK